MLRTRTVGQGLGNIWLTRVMFYDKNYNSIQVQSNNQLTPAVSDLQTIVPNFTGVTKQAKVSKVVAGITTILTSFSYDHMYRATAIDQRNNNGSTLRIASYEYNELGQLVKKNLKQVNSGSIPYHVTLGTANSVAPGQTSNITAQNSIIINPDFIAASGSTFTAKIATNYLQAVDYRYNIRGQMLNINNSKLADDGGVTNNDVNDLFGADILYNTVDANVGNTASFSGRISAVKWMIRNADGSKTNERSYKYSYDLLNRLTSATYAERTAAGTGAFNINSNGFNEGGITYDANGNILSLQRNSSAVGASSNTQIDNLTYTYDTSNPNRLKKVEDGVGANYVSYGFRNLTGSAADYQYDSSGNLTDDPYKGLTISYNELNKTDQIVITTAVNRFITYTYNSGGQMIRKQAYDNAVLQKTTDYIDGFVYENSTLAYFAIPEGRVINNGGVLTPEFVITDQQGNARISFKDDGNGRAVVTQENSYYAFGLTFATSPVTPPTLPNKNLYNGGSEWQNDFSNLPDYYNTFFRNYDQALARFVSLDPMAEAAESFSGYVYSGNNPVMFNDPLGDRWINPDGSIETGEGRHSASLDAYLASLFGDSGGGGGPTGRVGGYWPQPLMQGAGGYSMNSSGDLSISGPAAGDIFTRMITIPGYANSFVSAVQSGNYQIHGGQFQWNSGDPLSEEGSQTHFASIGARQQGDCCKTGNANQGGGETRGWTSKATGIAITMSAADGPFPFGEALGAAVVSVAAARDLTQIKHITYTLRNAKGQIYVGRTRGYGDPYSIMMKRYNNHHMKRLGYGNPTLDAVAQGAIVGFDAIRGREQQLIDAYGGVGSPMVGNSIRGVWKYNPLGGYFHAMSNTLFGQIAPYTGAF